VSRLLISYSHADTNFVVNLREALIECGHSPWIDWTHVRNARDWLNHVHNGIVQCTHFIFVVSHHSLASKYCAQELGYALSHNKRVIPLLQSRQMAGLLSFQFNLRESIDFSNNLVFDASLNMLLAAVAPPTNVNP
jgi:TIR domain-containing protein